MSYIDNSSIVAMMHMATNQLEKSNSSKKLTYKEYEQIYEGCHSARKKLEKELKKMEEIYDKLASEKTSLYQNMQKVLDDISSELLTGDWLSSSKHLLTNLDVFSDKKTFLADFHMQQYFEVDEYLELITSLIYTKEEFLSYYKKITDSEEREFYFNFCKKYQNYVLTATKLVGRDKLTTYDRLRMLFSYYKSEIQKLKDQFPTET